MKKKRTIVIVFSLIAVMIGSVLGQTAPKPAGDLSAEDIIKKSEAAMSPKEAASKIKTRLTKGTISIPAQGIDGTVEEYFKAPNKNYSIANLTNLGEFQEGFDGQVAWDKNPLTGLREKSGVELAVTKRNSDPQALINWKTYFTKAELTGSEKVGDYDTYVIKFTKGEDKPVTMYFDKKTFYVVRTDLTQETPQGTTPVSVYASDFRQVDGVVIPFESRQEVGPASIVTKITEVKHNVPVEDSKFKKPAN